MSAMWHILIPVASVGLPMLLQGCGGGDGPAPAPAPPPAPTGMSLNVLSYNLQWHSVRNQLPDLEKTLVANVLHGEANGAWDLMGFQECENITAALATNPRVGEWGTMQSPRDIAVAWNTTKFKKLDGGVEKSGEDGWGPRFTIWVRLEMLNTKEHVFFANVHGAVGKCNGTGGDEVYKDYTKIISDHKQDGDWLFFTGDFNCQSYDDVIKNLGKDYTDAAQASWFYPILYQPDHIFTTKGIKASYWTAVCCDHPGICYAVNETVKWSGSAACAAQPSDHQMLKGTFEIALGGSGDMDVVTI